MQILADLLHIPIYIYAHISPFNHTHEIHETISSARPRATGDYSPILSNHEPVYIKPANQAHGASYIDETKLIGGERLESRVAVPAAAAREYAIIFNCAGEWRSRSGFPRPH